MNCDQQIIYWAEGSRKAIRSVEHLVDGEFWLEALFWTHLAIEKAIKAHVVKTTRDIPPYIHKLTRLLEIAKLELDPGKVILCEELSKYQRLARYPDEGIIEPDTDYAKQLIIEAREMQEWLLKIL